MKRWLHRREAISKLKNRPIKSDECLYPFTGLQKNTEITAKKLVSAWINHQVDIKASCRSRSQFQPWPLNVNRLLSPKCGDAHTSENGIKNDNQKCYGKIIFNPKLLFLARSRMSFFYSISKAPTISVIEFFFFFQIIFKELT